MFTVIPQHPSRVCTWNGCNKYVGKAEWRLPRETGFPQTKRVGRGHINKDLWGLLRSVNDAAPSPRWSICPKDRGRWS